MYKLFKVLLFTLILLQVSTTNVFASSRVIQVRKNNVNIVNNENQRTPLDAIREKEREKEEEAKKIITIGDKKYKIIANLGEYKTTAFTPEEKGNHITASGVKPKLNHTVATDWKVIPKGSKLLVGDSEIVYTVEDNGVKGKVVDIFLATNKEAYKYGVKYKEIFLIEEVIEEINIESIENSN